jgi:hypothetical protein
VSLGAGGLFVAQAAPGPSESTIVTVTPERILDTRDPNNIGLSGPFVSAVSQKLQVTGSIQTATGTKTVVPTGATGVLLNVTPVNPTAAGFISIRPGDATGAATTSSLNFTTGVAGIVPNAVQVAMPTAGTNEGEIDITYDAYGQAGPTTDILIDVVGYMTSAGLQELVADVATKANAADVYTKSQVDARTLFATVAANATLVAGRQNGATAVTDGGAGTYTVTFGSTDISKCAFTATPSDQLQAPETIQVAVQGLATGSDNGVFVQTADAAGTLTDSGFFLVVNCPPPTAAPLTDEAPTGELESDLYAQGN